jgi:hypothetical protein
MTKCKNCNDTKIMHGLPCVNCQHFFWEIFNEQRKKENNRTDKTLVVTAEIALELVTP